MRRQTLFAVVFSILLVAYGWSLAQPKQPAKVGELDEVGRLLGRLGYTSIPVERLRSGHLALAVSVDGKRQRLLIDTGSPGTWLDRERTRHLNLDWKEEPIPGRAKDIQWDHSTSCEVTGLEIGGVKIPQISVFAFITSLVNGTLEAYGDEPVDGLLGGDVLSESCRGIDYASGRLCLNAGRAAAGAIRTRTADEQLRHDVEGLRKAAETLKDSISELRAAAKPK